jgi:hypothetical protein
MLLLAARLHSAARALHCGDQPRAGVQERAVHCGLTAPDPGLDDPSDLAGSAPD